MKWAFWISVSLVIYTYAGYPILLYLLRLFRRRPVRKGNHLPSVTLIIPVYNEQNRLPKKLKNSLELNYPHELMQIIVASDCSTDESDEIVRSYDDGRIDLARLETRQGKHYAQGHALNSARGEVIVFTDVSIMLPPESLRAMMQNFADPEVGCVTSRDIILGDGGVNNREGMYIRYDMLLRRLESEIGSTTGMSGSFYAARETLTRQWIPEMSNDFYIPLQTVRNGLRAIIDTAVTGHYRLVQSFQEEFIRKVRTIVHGLQVLFHFKATLNPARYGLFAIELISHKLFRWLVPLFMATAFVCNALLLNEELLYRELFAIQVAFYLVALLGHLLSGWQRLSLVRIVYFFVVANLAVAVAWVKYLAGERYPSWEPSKR